MPLPTVVKETLEDRGVLGQIKARIRAEVFHALEEDTEPSPPLGNENMFINELIREYYEFNKYKYSLSVMLAGMYMNVVFSSEIVFYYFLYNIHRYNFVSERYKECADKVFATLHICADVL